MWTGLGRSSCIVPLPLSIKFFTSSSSEVQTTPTDAANEYSLGASGSCCNCRHPCADYKVAKRIERTQAAQKVGEWDKRVSAEIAPVFAFLTLGTRQHV
jgi:hypothetical protein